MSFQKLVALTSNRRRLLPFIVSLEDYDILVAIGAADETGNSLGFKGLGLLKLAPPSTLQRRLKRLLLNKSIKKVTSRTDGRRVTYSLTAKTLAAFTEFISHSLN